MPSIEICYPDNTVVRIGWSAGDQAEITYYRHPETEEEKKICAENGNLLFFDNNMTEFVPLAFLPRILNPANWNRD